MTLTAFSDALIIVASLGIWFDIQCFALVAQNIAVHLPAYIRYLTNIAARDEIVVGDDL